MVNRLQWMQRAYPLDGSDVLLQKTPFGFDVSVWELLWWAFAGASVSVSGNSFTITGETGGSPGNGVPASFPSIYVGNNGNTAMG